MRRADGSLETAFWRKRDKRLKPHVQKSCKACEKSFTHPRSKPRLYCSYECQDKHMGGPIEVRLERMVDRRAAHECWEWLGTLNKYGYGTISVDGKTKLAHRAAYRTWVGPIEDGRYLCHTCDNRKCCNPNHLYQGTHADNMRDMVERGRQARPHSKSSHEELMERLRRRIDARTDKTSGCWVWTGKLNEGGYGVISVSGRSKAAHRAAYTAWVGPIPKGMSVCHTCDNPPCCNPAHLFVGTHADNMRDMSEKERVANTKLTWADRLTVVRDFELGTPAHVLAEMYAVSVSTIHAWARKLRS